MSQTKRAYDKFLLYALLIIALGVIGFISATTVIDPGYLNTTGPVLGSSGTFTGAVSGTSGSFSAALTGTTLDTGQGANELFDMDQNVLQASAVTFSTVNTGQGANELFDMDQNVLQASAVTFSTINTGQGANELFDMNQNVETTSAVTFDSITLSGVTISEWGGDALAATGPDFIIIRYGAFTLGINGSDGTIAFNETYLESNLVFQACSDVLTDGGWIHAKQGTFVFEETWNIEHNGITFSGVGGEVFYGQGTILYASDTLDADVIRFNDDSETVINKANTFRDFCIDGNGAEQGATSHGIYAYHAVRCYFENIEIRYVADFGLYFDGYRTGSAILYSYDNKVVACKFMDCDFGFRTRSSEENDLIGIRTGGCDSAGIYLASNINTVLGGTSVYDYVGLRVSGARTKVIGWTCDRPDREAVLIDGAAVQLKIVDCHFHGASESLNNTYSVIRSAHADADYIYISGCSITVVGLAPKYSPYVIHMDNGGEDNWLITENDFRAFGTAWILKDAGAGGNNVEDNNWVIP